MSNIEPRIAGHEFHWVKVSGGYVLAIGITASWLRPHRVTFRGWNKFWVRVGRQACELDVAQLRQLFLAAPTMSEAVRNFRADRLMQIKTGTMPLSKALQAGPVAVLHMIPFAALIEGKPLQLPDRDWLENRGLPILYANANSPGPAVPNLDGVLRVAVRANAAVAYVQLFRDGCIEAADVALAGATIGTPPKISAASFEPVILDNVKQYLQVQQKMDATVPVVVAISLLNAVGTTIPDAPRPHDPYEYTGGSVPSIDRDDVLLPPVILQNWDDDLPHVLRPAFDALWNACGYERSQSYDDQGNWHPVRQ